MQEVRYVRSKNPFPKILEEILPQRLKEELAENEIYRIEELRLHTRRFASVSIGRKNYITRTLLSEEEMRDILLKMCGGSLYAYHDSILEGYLTLEGGIRVGVCGSAAMENQRMIGVDRVSGLIIRIPHFVSVDASQILSLLRSFQGLGGILLYSPPGAGKTTLLRSIAVQASRGESAFRTVVVDSRKELGFFGGGESNLLDFLDGYPRALGIEIAVRSLGAELIVCDEIGSMADARAILSSANCGVPIVASTHAGTIRGLLSRPAIRLLHDRHVFGAYVGLTRNTTNRLSLTVTEWEDANADIEDVGNNAHPPCRMLGSKDLGPI